MNKLLLGGAVAALGLSPQCANAAETVTFGVSHALQGAAG